MWQECRGPAQLPAWQGKNSVTILNRLTAGGRMQMGSRPVNYAILCGVVTHSGLGQWAIWTGAVTGTSAQTSVEMAVWVQTNKRLGITLLNLIHTDRSYRSDLCLPLFTKIKDIVSYTSDLINPLATGIQSPIIWIYYTLLNCWQCQDLAPVLCQQQSQSSHFHKLPWHRTA